MVSKASRSAHSGGPSTQSDGTQRDGRGSTGRGRGAKASKQAHAKTVETRHVKRVSSRGRAGGSGRGRGSRGGRGGKGSGRGAKGGWQRGPEVVGRLLEVYCTSKKDWLQGRVDQYNKRSGKHLVTYKTGDEHWLILAEKRLRWITKEDEDSEEEGEDPDHDDDSAAASGKQNQQMGSVQGDEDVEESSVGVSAQRSIDGVQDQHMGGGQQRGDAVQPATLPAHRQKADPGGNAAQKHEIQSNARSAYQKTEPGCNSAGSPAAKGCEAVSRSPAPRGKQGQVHSSRHGLQNKDGEQLQTCLPAAAKGTQQPLDHTAADQSKRATPPSKQEAGASHATDGDEAFPKRAAADPELRPTPEIATLEGHTPPTSVRPASSEDKSAMHPAENTSSPAGIMPPTNLVCPKGNGPAPQIVSLDTRSLEAAQSEARVAWERAREMAGKAVKLVKLAQEGGASESRNAGIDNGSENVGSKSLPSGSQKASQSGRKTSVLGRRKLVASASGAKHSALHGPEAAVRARVSVYWPGDQVYYKGRIIDYNSEKNVYCIRYDDNEEEWLNLSEEYFKWLGPRARSAGFSQSLAAAIMALGPEGIIAPSAATLAEKSRGADATGPRGEAAVGYRIGILWEADGNFHYGEVLAYSEQKHKHHILFDDGEDEWIQLTKEVKVWRHKGRGASLPAGLGQGEDTPRGRNAIGWRIGVYWKEDTVFYEGEIKGYDSATGKHHILYDDSEDEYISLSTEKIKWMVPPGLVSEAKSGRGRSLRRSYGPPGKKICLSSVSEAANACAPTPARINDDAQRPSAPLLTQPQESVTNVPVSQVPVLDGVISRKLRRSGLQEGTANSGMDMDDMLVGITGPLRRRDNVQDKMSMHPSIESGTAHGPVLSRLALVERMLARVLMAQDAMKLGCPAGAQPCQAAALRITSMDTSLPPAGLRKIRTSCPSFLLSHDPKLQVLAPTMPLQSGQPVNRLNPTGGHLDMPVGSSIDATPLPCASEPSHAHADRSQQPA